MTDITRIAVPNKGRLSEPSVDLLRAAGLVLETSSRALSVPVRNMPVEVLFVRAEDIPELVHDDVVQFGITGLDLVAESVADTTVVQELGFGRCKLTAAVDESSTVFSIDGFSGLRVATSHPLTVNRFFSEKGIDITTIPLRGSVEVAPKLDIADAIVDLVSSGSTMMINSLRPIATVLESQAALITAGDRASSPLTTMIRSVVAATRKRYVMMNVQKESIAEIERIIPGADSPTVISLAHHGMYAMHSVVDADEMWRVLPALEAAGASAILVLPIEQMIP
ncbi:MAG: ATP phosphoribosyltransferase [Actinomycetia bacterium]|nr:ATP phosphoribosyltransferase [Actinomycetes bacterium]